MKTITVIKLCITIVITLIVTTLAHTTSSLKKENERLQNNQTLLLSEKNALIVESRKYKVADSLNAIKVNELRLTLDEYRRYRTENLALINKLNVDKRDMQKVIDAQTETIYKLNANLRDTIILKEEIPHTLKSFQYRSEWTDIDGLIDVSKDKVDLAIRNRESLVLVETIEYKRFWGFLWKTKNIKNRSVDILSRNPNTEIVDASYESIER